MTRDDELDLGGDPDDVESVLVCVRVADAIGPIAPRSEIISCDSCNRMIWIGPIEFALASQGTYYDRILCSRCAIEEAQR